MIRTRLHLRTPLLALLTRALTLALALILLWYGAMLALLAAKVSPASVQSLSDYRGIYDFLAGLHSSQFTTRIRLAGGIGGAILFLALSYLALQELPRPYLSHVDPHLLEGEGGTLAIAPRAIERLAEIAAAANPDVSGASGRLGVGAVSLSIGVRQANTVAATLRDVRERVARELARNELPDLAVDVTVTGYEPTTGRNLS